MKFKIIYFVAAACIVLAFNACKKDLLKANTNPTTFPADQYNPNFLLTTVQLNYTGSPSFGDDNWYDEWGNIGGFIQHTASTNTGFYPGDKYLNAVGSFGVYFNNAYQYQVQPVVELYKLTLNKPEYKNLHQIARMMKALVFERITDLYGDVPYTQAGLGFYERIYTPVYDKQQDIYKDLLKEVSEATDSLDDKADVPTGDVFYAADPDTEIERWKRFGYTLQLRMAMRLTKIDPATAQTYVKKVDGKTMQSNDDNAVVQHQDGADATRNRDSWSITGQDSADLKLCSTYINFLKDNNDPRLPVVSWIFATGDRDPADQNGLPPGFIVGGKKPEFDIRKNPSYNKQLGMQGYSRLSDIILNNDAPTIVLTYAESEFLLADAVQRWGIGSTSAEEHYENGVLAALTQLAVYGDDGVVDDGDAQDYVDAHHLSTNNDTALNQINTQYWACTLMDEYEAWCNWRRTSNTANTNMITHASGYPQLIPTDYPGNVTNGTIPRRLEYPTDQKISNTTNYNAAVARLTGGDKITSRVWWDTK